MVSQLTDKGLPEMTVNVLVGHGNLVIVIRMHGIEQISMLQCMVLGFRLALKNFYGLVKLLEPK